MGRDEVQRRLSRLVTQCVDLYDFAPAGYLIVDGDARLVSVNLVAATLLGRERADLIGRGVVDLVARHDKRRFAEFWERVTQAGEDVSCEVDLRHAMGDFVTVACHVRLATELDSWIVALIDVTDLHQARRVAEDRADLEARADVAQRLYDSIRQRLFGITVMVEAAAQAPGAPARVRNALDRVHRELADIITDIREIIFGEVDGVSDGPPRPSVRPSGADPPEADPGLRSD